MKGTIQEHIELREWDDGLTPFIVGHRIRIEDIVIWHEEMRMSPYEIVHNYPTITLADVYAALAYYFDNRADIDLAMAEGIRFVEEYRREHPEVDDWKLKRKPSA